MFPVTPSGRIVAGILVFFGILTIAFPVIIVGGNFENLYGPLRKRKTRESDREYVMRITDVDEHDLHERTFIFCPKMFKFLKIFISGFPAILSKILKFLKNFHTKNSKKFVTICQEFQNFEEF